VKTEQEQPKSKPNARNPKRDWSPKVSGTEQLVYVSTARLQISFSEIKAQMVPSRIQILVKPGFGGLIQGQIYNPVPLFLVPEMFG